MTTEVLVVDSHRWLPWQPTRGEPGVLGVLAVREARRILTSPAILLMAGVVVLILGLDSATLGDNGRGLFHRAALAEMLATVGILYFGPITFVATHLAATSAARSGSNRLLVAAPVGQRRRDLALCLGVLVGPAALALALAMAAAAAAGAGHQAPSANWTWIVGPWTWIDVLQVPAIVLGAGILGVVVARWLPYPGSLLFGFVGMILGTIALLSTSPTALRPWFAPWVSIQWWSGDAAWTAHGSQAWHLAYLLGLSGFGVCAIALRQAESRRRWIALGGIALTAVLSTGWLQLPLGA
ncbi:MAG: hypothetical protein ABI912_06640 [Actinomycetota bacterium]